MNALVLSKRAKRLKEELGYQLLPLFSFVPWKTNTCSNTCELSNMVKLSYLNKY